MPSELKLDTRQFASALKDMMQFTRKDASELINNAMGDVALHSVRDTKRADAAAMDKLLVASRRGRMLKSGRRSKSKRGMEVMPTGYVFAVINYYRTHGKMPPYAFGIMPDAIASVQLRTRSDITRAAQAYVRAKKRSIAYIAVGFIAAARFFGKSVRTKLSSKGWAAKSTGRKATPNNLTAKILNFSRGAHKAPKINQVVQQALDTVARGMMDHAAKKIKARWEKKRLQIVTNALGATVITP